MNLIFNAQMKLVDESTGTVYKGIAPRDLEIEDTFQSIQRGVIKTLKVTNKYSDDDGMQIVECDEVMQQ